MNKAKFGRLWTEAEEMALKSMHSEGKTMEQMTKAINRSEKAISCRVLLLADKEISAGGNKAEVLAKWKITDDNFNKHKDIKKADKEKKEFKKEESKNFQKECLEMMNTMKTAMLSMQSDIAATREIMAKMLDQNKGRFNQAGDT
jgi:hypothetical protein